MMKMQRDVKETGGMVNSSIEESEEDEEENGDFINDDDDDASPVLALGQRSVGVPGDFANTNKRKPPLSSDPRSNTNGKKSKTS